MSKIPHQFQENGSRRRFFSCGISGLAGLLLVLTAAFLAANGERLFRSPAVSFVSAQFVDAQARLLNLIRYADLTGAEGAAFWLVFVNVAALICIERHLSGGGGDRNASERWLKGKNVLPVLLVVMPLGYAAFVILRPSTAPPPPPLKNEISSAAAPGEYGFSRIGFSEFICFGSNLPAQKK